MKDPKKEYFEQSVSWNQDYLNIPAEKERIQEIINAVPPDTYKILDVGCGNGAFVNTLISVFPNKYNEVIGLDSSKEALKYVRSEKIHGNIADLPFGNDSFDLVSCLEVLEHLSQNDFIKGISEVQRVSRRYIIVTVPNQEDLEFSLVMCPKCCCWFNRYFHMRSFNKDDLYNLFKDLKLLHIKEIGPVVGIKEIGPVRKIRAYKCMLLYFYRVWKKPLPSERTICPQCGYQNKKELPSIERNNRSAHFLAMILLLIKPLVKLLRRKRRWLLAVYEKSNR